MYKRITSENNPLIKRINGTKNRKFRDKHSLMFIEGLRLVKEAKLSSVKFDGVVLRDDPSVLKQFSDELSGIDARVYLVDEKLFARISHTKSPQGVAALINFSKNDLSDMVFDGANLFLIAERLNDPGNLGTIIRSADGAGFSAVILSSGCVDIYNPKTIRAAMGSIFHIPVYHGGNIEDIIGYLKDEEIKIYGTDVGGKRAVYGCNLKKNFALIVGNEAFGVTGEALSLCDEVIYIPMGGKAESLNASVAASVLMFESVRQRYLNGELN